MKFEVDEVCTVLELQVEWLNQFGESKRIFKFNIDDRKLPQCTRTHLEVLPMENFLKKLPQKDSLVSDKKSMSSARIILPSVVHTEKFDSSTISFST